MYLPYFESKQLLIAKLALDRDCSLVKYGELI